MQLSKFSWIPAAVVFSVSTAHAGPKECVADHAAGKKLRSEGALIAAKDKFLSCAADACPKVVRQECLSLVQKVAAELPSVVIVAKDDTGADVGEGRVFLDGEEVQGGLGGRAITLDPGSHVLRFVSADGREAEVKFVARDGDKSRSVQVALAPSTSAPEPPVADAEPESSTPVVAYVLAGVAVVALGSFTYFALDGSSKKSDIDECKPKCKQSDVDDMRRSFLIGDISLGIGAVAAGGAAYFFLTGSAAEQPPTSEFNGRTPFFITASGRF